MYLFTTIVIYMVWALTQGQSDAYIENVTMQGCEKCRFQITCRDFSTKIAIWHVDFQSENTKKYQDYIKKSPFPIVHPQTAVIQRCSGLNHCNFILTEDCPGAKHWGNGIVSIKYACISEESTTRFCNRVINITVAKSGGGGLEDIAAPRRRLEGFIHNPGYPRFYANERECYWRITAPQNQNILLTILDLNLAPVSAVTDNRPHYRSLPQPDRMSGFEDDCSNSDNTNNNNNIDNRNGKETSLEIYDEGQLIADVCNMKLPPRQILARRGTVDIRLSKSGGDSGKYNSGGGLKPQSGLLIHYVAVGCRTPTAPGDGYLVFRNSTVAQFQCCVGYRFVDDARRTKQIECVAGVWNTILPLPDCERDPDSYSVIPIQWKIGNNNSITEDPSEEASDIVQVAMVADIVPPIILIVVLFMANFVVLLYIYKKKQKYKYIDYI